MVDQILSQEDEECQALVSIMNAAKKAARTDESRGQEENMLGGQKENMSEFGSEAEDYDRLFMDVAFQQEQQTQIPISQDSDCPLLGPQEMDTSVD